MLETIHHYMSVAVLCQVEGSKLGLTLCLKIKATHMNEKNL